MDGETDYHSRFTKLVEVANHYGAGLLNDKILEKHELPLLGRIDSLSENIDSLIYDQPQTIKAGADRLKAFIFIQGADHKRYGDLHRKLKESLALGDNKYPATLADAVSIMNKFTDLKRISRPNNEKTGPSKRGDKENMKPNANNQDDAGDDGQEGVTLVQKEEDNSSDKNDIPEAEMQLLQQAIENDSAEDEEAIHFLLAQVKNKSGINRDWVLLDNQSTCHVFNNKRLLKNIRTCNEKDAIRIKSNGNGVLIVNEVGDLPGVGTVHYHKDSIANVLSFSKISKDYQITFNNKVDNCFIVHRRNNKLKFLRSPKGLYFYDTRKPTSGLQMVQTVKDNENAFTKRQVQQARLARQLYTLLGRPSHDNFLKFVRNNYLKNCPIDVDDANRSIRIYGPDIPALRCKTVRSQTHHVIVPEISPVPEEILRDHPNIHLCTDICFINIVPFLITISRTIKLRTVDHIRDVQQETVIKSLQHVIKIYTSRGFSVPQIHADNGFRCMENDLLPRRLNLAAAGEHVPEGERRIRTLKERTRACIHGLPYRRHPVQLIVANVRFHNTWLNRFPTKDSASITLSPRTIVWGDSPNFDINCRLEFGCYCEVYEPRTSTNSTAARTVGAIALYPSGNSQGGYRFLLLNTGRVVTRNLWTVLPIPMSAIDSIESLAKKDKQPDISKHGYIFSWARIRNFHNTDLSSLPQISDEGANVLTEI